MEDAFNNLLKDHLILTDKIKNAKKQLILTQKIIKLMVDKDDSLIFHEISDDEILSEHWKDIRSTLYDIKSMTDLAEDFNKNFQLNNVADFLSLLKKLE